MRLRLKARPIKIDLTAEIADIFHVLEHAVRWDRRRRRQHHQAGAAEVLMQRKPMVFTTVIVLLAVVVIVVAFALGGN